MCNSILYNPLCTAELHNGWTVDAKNGHLKLETVSTNLWNLTQNTYDAGLAQNLSPNFHLYVPVFHNSSTEQYGVFSSKMLKVLKEKNELYDFLEFRFGHHHR